jgi:hypothetical protein
MAKRRAPKNRSTQDTYRKNGDKKMVVTKDKLHILILLCIIGFFICTIIRFRKIEKKLQAMEVCIMTTLDFEKPNGEQIK